MKNSSEQYLGCCLTKQLDAVAEPTSHIKLTITGPDALQTFPHSHTGLLLEVNSVYPPWPTVSFEV